MYLTVPGAEKNLFPNEAKNTAAIHAASMQTDRRQKGNQKPSRGIS